MRIKNENGIIIGGEVRAGMAKQLGFSTEDQKFIDLIKKVEGLCFVFYREGYIDCGAEMNQAKKA